MTPPSSSGEPTQQQIYDAILERNELLGQIAATIEVNTRELQRTQSLLDRRPPGSELDFKRRRLLVGLLAAILLVIWGHDEHVELCGPGARAEHAVEALLRGEGRQGIETAARGADAPKLCDVTFPLHDHDGNGWPAPFNVLGLLAYLALFVGLAGWLLSAYRQMQADRRKEALAASREEAPAASRDSAARTRSDD